MRVFANQQDISVLAISGTYVVLLAFDVTEAKRKGLLGFAIHRQDHQENEQYWLRGFKTFKETFPNPPPGSLVSTLEHPIQAFLWGDYTAKPEHQYTYTVVPLYGQPKNLQEGPRIAVTISTLNKNIGKHTIIFNRGVAGSQAYARKFGNVSPDKIKDPQTQQEAYRWLSRGLEETMLDFIEQAHEQSFGLRASVYEFNWAPVLEAFRKAHEAGADVKIIYDRRTHAPFKATEEAAQQAGLLNLTAASGGQVMIPRQTNSAISHNKFIVLLQHEKPIEVWTGSTNFTEGGIFGQSNIGHVIRDEAVAQAYFDYWQRLSTDPDFKVIRKGNVEATPDPEGLPQPDSLTPIFSPRTSLKVLEWYAERMRDTEQTLAFTAAFGISSTISPVLEQQKPSLRYLMVESEGVNESQRQAFKKVEEVQNNRIAKGSILKRSAEDEAVGGALHRWLDESLTDLNRHVRFLHTKYLLIDPLTTQPLVISGSANFSSASTNKNDENMILIRGEPDVADAFFGEFMRLFNHFYFRSVAQRLAQPHTAESIPFLEPDDSWTEPYFTEGTTHFLERTLYATAMRRLA